MVKRNLNKMKNRSSTSMISSYSSPFINMETVDRELYFPENTEAEYIRNTYDPWSGSYNILESDQAELEKRREQDAQQREAYAKYSGTRLQHFNDARAELLKEMYPDEYSNITREQQKEYDNQVSSMLLKNFDNMAETSPYWKRYGAEYSSMSDKDKQNIVLDALAVEKANSTVINNFKANHRDLFENATPEEKEYYNNLQYTQGDYAGLSHTEDKNGGLVNKLADAWDSNPDEGKSLIVDSSAVFNQGIKDNIAHNLPWTKRLFNTVAGTVTTGVGDLITFGGFLAGIEESIRNNDINKLIDNPITNYGNDIASYGTFIPENIEEAKESGLSYTEVMRASDDTLLQSAIHTLGEGIQQEGFSMASMWLSFGLDKIANPIGRGVNAMTKAARLNKVANFLNDASKVSKLGKFGNFVGVQVPEFFTSRAFLVPSLTSTSESVMEALGTKDEVMQRGKDRVDLLVRNEAQKIYDSRLQDEDYKAQINKDIESQFIQSLNSLNLNQIMDDNGNTKFVYTDEEGRMVNPDDLKKQIAQQKYNSIWDEVTEEAKEDSRIAQIQQQIENDAYRAAWINFGINQAINGSINATWKGTIQAPSVRRRLQNSRLTRWMYARPRIVQEGEEFIGKISGFRKAFTALEEPLGEGLEEFVQSLSNASSVGGAMNNIEGFILNKYYGDGQATVGSMFGGSWMAAAKSLGEALSSEETYQAAGMGALSSTLPMFSGNQRIGTGNMTTKIGVDRNGNKFKYQSPELTRWSRGVDAEGNRESFLHYINRINPFSTGIGRGLREIKEATEESQHIADALNDWLKDPDNKAKVDGTVGTLAWAEKMERQAIEDDEFGYRNSALGKLVNDVVMLQHLKKTDIYESWMQQIEEVLSAKEGSEEAKKLIDSIRNDASSEMKNASDQEILSTLKENAQKVKDTMADAETTLKEMEQQFGIIDDDTKQALVYAKLQIKDWERRGKSIDEELAKLNIQDSRESGAPMSKEQKKILSMYGSREEVERKAKSLDTEKKNIQKRIDSAKARLESEERKQRTQNEATIKKNIAEYDNQLNQFTEEEKELLFNEDPTEIIEDELRKNITVLEQKSKKTSSSKKVLNRYKSQLKAIENLKRKYGSVEDAWDKYKEIVNSKKVEEEKLKNVSQEITRDTETETTLKEDTEKLENTDSVLTELNKFLEETKGEKYILNESDIMSLGMEERALMLLRGKNKTYKAKVKKDGKTVEEERNYYSKEQQRVIDNLIVKGTLQDGRFLEKVRDRGLMEYKRKEFTKEYSAILENQEEFGRYVENAKATAKDVLAQRRYAVLSRITDYKEFVKEMKNLEQNSNPREQRLIMNAFEKNKGKHPLYQQFRNEYDIAEKLLNHIDSSSKFDNLSDNDKEMFAHTIKYALDNGIDLNDTDAVINALSEKDEEGKYKFESYIDDYNGKVSELEHTVFTSIGETIQLYKDVQSGYIKEQKDKEALEANSDSEKAKTESNPPARKDANPDNAGNNKKSNKDNREDEENKAREAELQSQLDAYNNLADTTAESDRLNGAIDSSDFDNNVKSKAKEIVKKAFNESADLDEFNRKVKLEALALKSKAQGSVEAKVGTLLNKIAKTPNLEDEQNQGDKGKQENKDKQDNQEKGKEKTTTLIDNLTDQIEIEDFYGYNMFSHSTPDSGFIASINIAYIRAHYPNSALVAYYDQHNIEKRLKKGILTKKKPIYFITDNALTQAVVTQMSDKYDAKVNLPIVAVVEDRDGTITIEGKKYQPVAVMSTTGAEGSAGSNNMSIIRDNAQKNTESTQLVTDENNNLISTIQYGTIKAQPIDSGGTTQNNDVLNIVSRDMSTEDRNALEQLNKAERRKQKSYKEAREEFLNNLEVVTLDGKKQLAFYPNTLNEVKRKNPIYIFIKDIDKTLGANSNKTLLETVLEGNISDIVSFNSKTIGAVKALEEFINTFKTVNLSNRSEIETALRNLERSNTGSRGLSNYLNISLGNYFTIGNVENGTVTLNLNVSGTDIPLITFNPNSLSSQELENIKAQFIKNLIYDESNKIRSAEFNGRQVPIVKWQINYNDANIIYDNTKQSTAAKIGMERAYDEGLFEARATSFQYRIAGIAVNKPSTNNNEEIRTPAHISNSDNANTSNSLSNTNTSGSASTSKGIVDTDSGVIIDDSSKTTQDEENESENGENEDDESSDTPKSTNYSWKDVVETKGAKFLKRKGINKQAWDNLSEDERRQIIEC